MIVFIKDVPTHDKNYVQYGSTIALKITGCLKLHFDYGINQNSADGVDNDYYSIMIQSKCTKT